MVLNNVMCHNMIRMNGVSFQFFKMGRFESRSIFTSISVLKKFAKNDNAAVVTKEMIQTATLNVPLAPGLESMLNDEQRTSEKAGSRGRHHRQGRRWKENPSNYRRTKYSFDKTKEYALEEAIHHLRKASWAQYDESVDVIFRLKIDPRKADQLVRGVYKPVYPIGRKRLVYVFVDDDEMAKKALENGAERAGGVDLVNELKDMNKVGKKIDYVITTPSFLPKLGVIAKRLGPHFLMPSPKYETVTFDIVPAIQAALFGQRPFRCDRYGQVQLTVGKISSSDEHLMTNIFAAYDTIEQLRPDPVKRAYILKISMSSSMGPGIYLDPRRLGERVLDELSQNAFGYKDISPLITEKAEEAA
uniref:Ribosomal protein n=1 Tax=Timspurckia oligopyrenoides TaxID=708627 RepID=A0A7S0ZER7_9RHOD